MKLLLIRHGEMICDPFVCPPSPVSNCLSELGIRQATKAGAALKDKNITYCFSSPYGRALQTAEIAMTDKKISINLLDFLHEWEPNHDMNDLPSTEFEDIIKLNGGKYAEEMWKTEMGEGCYEMFARICPSFLNELDKIGICARQGGFVIDEKNKDAIIAVFAHGGSLNVLLTFLLEMPPFPIGRFSFSLAGIATIDFLERKGINYPQLIIE